jgi:pyruvate dehydrogenase E2 component (dihydrolipoamide acetyltransferase)
MAVSVVMPALEVAQETGKLIAWLRKEGDLVARGEPLLEIETDKATVEVEAPADGILEGVTGEPGTDVPVGHVIAWIVKPGEVIPKETPAAEAPVRTENAQTKALPPALKPTTDPGSRRISPKARRLAEQAGLDLGGIPSSGPEGEILASDVTAALEQRDLERSSSAAQPLSTVHRLMAERTARSWTTVPHFFLQNEVEASGLNRFRAAAAEKNGKVRITHTDVLLALTARALSLHPRMNASWDGYNIRLNPEVHIALAIAVEHGVITPVIRHADRASVAEIAAQRLDLVERGRSGRLRPDDLTGATFTISNLGMFGVDSFSAIIVPPQAAILAVGRIADRVVASSGVPVVRSVVTLTLSSDHRVLDGAKAAVFLQELTQAMQEPERLLG